jgi:exodeoxyribonuclease VII large subunit
MQLSFFQPPIWTVSKLTLYLRDLLENDYSLQDLWVQGEVSNFSKPNSGHMYFTLKDNTCSIRCVMWRPNVKRQVFMPKDGMAIEVHGTISIYETAGQYQLYADVIRPAGEGELYQEYLRLKARLEEEGLFDPERKRPIPRWPQRIGIVTSPTGAAIRDMLNTITRRYPLVEVVLAPTQVQGDQAPDGIIAALRKLNDAVCPDVILLARGGGSIEDLWAFNDENVARAIAASQAPVISGVGHETDTTIADFVSDLRAPTPTAAAELATPNKTDLLFGLDELQRRMGQAMESVLEDRSWGLSRMSSRLALLSPISRIRSYRQHNDELSARMQRGLQYHLQLEKTRLQALHLRLESLSPHAILKRGFAIIKDEQGRIVSSTAQVRPGQGLQVSVSDGQFGVHVDPDEQRNGHDQISPL